MDYIAFSIREFGLRLKGMMKQRTRNNPQTNNILHGKEESELDVKAVSMYHSAVLEDTIDIIPESIWNDLNLDDVFFKINRTRSAPGSQYLYHEMHRYKKGTDFPPKLFSVYQKIQNNTTATARFAKILLRLRSKNSYQITSVLFGTIPGKPAYFPFIILMTLFFIASVAGLIFVSREFLLAVLVSGIINTLFQQFIAIKISSCVPDMGILGRMLSVASSLADTGENTFMEIEVLQNYKKFTKSLQRKFGWLLLDTQKLDELSASVIAYINHLLLVNLIVFFNAAKYVEKHKRELIEIFEAIGSLDASMAIAEYISAETCCCAELVDENRIDVVSLYHPLLENPIANAFSLSNHSCLITGSNMAGKTTFIKTVGVNLVLARTLGFCHAESAVFPTASVLSTIRRGDDLKYNKSYYYVEIETILGFIRATDSNERYLFLIDEIFRGTNTIERLAASSSVLKYLGDRGMVLVTTHDIELEYMLDERYRMFHFQEQIEENRHFFDYKIKSGACRSRNAIKLLELTGYPIDITEEAYATCILLNKGNTIVNI